MAGKGHALARDELIRVLTVHTGTTTSNGAAGGSSLIDSSLIGINDFVTHKTILIMSGDARYETKSATAFNPATGDITVNPPFSAQITTGTLFKIINLPAGSSLIIVIATVLSILDLVNAELVLTETGGTVTATGLGTEDNIYVNDAPAGEFEPRKVVVDLSDLAGGETATLRTYYRIKSGGVARLKGAPVIFNGVQAEPMKDIELEPNRFGIVVTIEATVGVIFDWEVHYGV